MTKPRNSTRRSTNGSKHRGSAPATPKRNTATSAACTPKDKGSNSDSGVRDMWDLDAPKFYDFGNSKTPGPKPDKWFDYAHPTPALKNTRLSRLSFSSTDSYESLVPTRLSLSPSRVVMDENGRLTLDSEMVSKSKVKSATNFLENDEFSDPNDEIEFNNWKRDISLPDGRNTEELANCRRDTIGTEEVAKQTEPAPTNADIEWTTERTAKRPAGSREAAKNSSQAASSRIASGRVAKKTVAPAARPAARAAPAKLTVPVEVCGFMRPTKVASRRVLVKKREKENQQLIAEAIAKSINRRLSHNIGSGLTVPKPFHFHDSKHSSNDEVSAADILASAASVPEKKLSKEAHASLLAKLTAKRVMSDEDVSETNEADPVHEATPHRKQGAAKLTRTVPVTPQFAKSKRSRRETEDVPSDPARNEKALDIEKKAARILAKARANNSQQLVRAQPPKRTVPQPFTFRSDTVAERHLMKLREEIAMLKVEEKALRQFRAMPLPDFPTPKKHKREVPQEPMHASPFHLQTDSRGEAYQSQLKARLEELEEKQRERREFKARPIPPSIDQPFVPQPSTIPLTAIEEILLSTELRSEERRAYDDDRMERERIREEVLARKRLENERREEEEIKRLRKILVHKAQPIRHYKPVDIQPSDRPLTVPKTPQWHVRTRDWSTTTPTPIPTPASTLDPATPTPMPSN